MGERHRPIRARSAPGQVAGAATETPGLEGHRPNRRARLRSPHKNSPVPGARYYASRAEIPAGRIFMHRKGAELVAACRGRRETPRFRPIREGTLARLQQAPAGARARKQGCRGDPSRRRTADPVEMRTFGGMSRFRRLFEQTPLARFGATIDIDPVGAVFRLFRCDGDGIGRRASPLRSRGQESPR